MSQQTNRLGKETVLIQLPSESLNNPPNHHFKKMIDGQIVFAKSVMGKDNVLVLASGRVLEYAKRFLPRDVVIDVQVSDLWLRDLAPIRNTFFTFMRPNGKGFIQQQNFKSYLSQCTQNGHAIQQSVLKADGGNVVHNDEDTAIITTRILSKNSEYSYDQIFLELKKKLNLRNIVLVPEVSGEVSGHADLTLSFLDRNTVAFTDLTRKGRLRKVLQKKLGSKFRLVELDSIVIRDNPKFVTTACGLHVNILSTDNYLYVPTYGMDPINRLRKGQSTSRDMRNVVKIAQNTKKTVVPVPVPFSVCELGGGTRCLSWQIRGPVADDLILSARDGTCVLRTIFHR